MTTEERLVRLERQNQRLKKGMFGIILAGISLLIMGQAAPPKIHDVLRARKIQIVSPSGVNVVELENWKHGGWISTASPSGSLLSNLAADDVGNGHFIIRSAKGKKVVTLGTTENSEGMISTYNSTGKRIVDVGATIVGEGAIVTYNSTGKKIVELGSADGNGEITNFDSNGTTLMRLTSRTSGEGVLTYYNRAGKPSKMWPSKYK